MKFLQMKKYIYLEHALFVLTVLSILFIVNSIFKLQALTQSALEKETFTFQVSKQLLLKIYEQPKGVFSCPKRFDLFIWM